MSHNRTYYERPMPTFKKTDAEMAYEAAVAGIETLEGFQQIQVLKARLHMAYDTTGRTIKELKENLAAALCGCGCALLIGMLIGFGIWGRG